jgi:hypothetical protein
MLKTSLGCLTFLTMTSILPHDALGGWEANPDVVARATTQRPEFNFAEAKVPAYDLPDPLLQPDGTRVESPAQWVEQRERLLELFRRHVYGRSPGLPDQLRFEPVEVHPEALDGKATLKRIRIISQVAERQHTFEVTLFVPNASTGPAPLFLLLNNRDRGNVDPTRNQRSEFWPVEEGIARGYAMAVFQVADLAPIDPTRYREGIIQTFESNGEEPPGDAWKALAAWAWGASRVMDYLETDPAINASRVAVLGHSRGGKAALWTGAQDERFALTISNNSGCGGAALSRRRFAETVARINTAFPYWFCDNFRAFNDQEDTLPVDQHMLIALAAPRAVYVASADQDLWADPQGEFLGLAHASPVFGLWGYQPLGQDAMPALDKPLHAPPLAYHIRKGGHNLTLYDWSRYMDFADQLWTRQPGAD